MQYCILNRADFASLLGQIQKGERYLPQLERGGAPQDSPINEKLFVCWDNENSRNDALPVLIVVADDDLNHFLAWALTFLPAYRPLTSFFRIVPWTLFSLVQKRVQSTATNRAPVLVGAILGEVLTNANSRGFMDSLPMTAFESTCSWAMSRALAMGLDPKVLPYVSTSWNSMREIMGQSSLRVPPGSMEQIWSILPRLVRGGQTDVFQISSPQLATIEEACLEIQSWGKITGVKWERLSQGRISDAAIANSMSSTKERRVEVFESVVKELVRSQTNEISTSFLVGYLASLISGGSLEHAQLITPLQNDLPTAMIWYGICVGLLPSSRILSDDGHLGLRISRLLRRHEALLSPPYSDISLSELEVLMRGEPQSRIFRQSHANFLRIELAPMVTAVTRPAVRTTVGQEQLGLFGSEDRPNSQGKDRLHELMVALRDSLSIVESLLGTKSLTSNTSGGQYRGKRRR